MTDGQSTSGESPSRIDSEDVTNSEEFEGSSGNSESVQMEMQMTENSTVSVEEMQKDMESSTPNQENNIQTEVSNENADGSTEEEIDSSGSSLQENSEQSSEAGKKNSEAGEDESNVNVQNNGSDENAAKVNEQVNSSGSSNEQENYNQNSSTGQDNSDQNSASKTSDGQGKGMLNRICQLSKLQIVERKLIRTPQQHPWRILLTQITEAAVKKISSRVNQVDRSIPQEVKDVRTVLGTLPDSGPRRH